MVKEQDEEANRNGKQNFQANYWISCFAWLKTVCVSPLKNQILTIWNSTQKLWYPNLIGILKKLAKCFSKFFSGTEKTHPHHSISVKSKFKAKNLTYWQKYNLQVFT